MEYLFIYLLQICGLFETLIKPMIFISFISFFGVTFIWALSKDNVIQEEITNFLIKKLTIIGIITIITSFIFTLLPTRPTLLLMGGVYYGKKAVNIVVTNDKIDKVNKIIDLQLDKYIQDLKSEVVQND